MISHQTSKWVREANIDRYRKLLKTLLTQCERSYVERRLQEELASGQVDEFDQSQKIVRSNNILSA